MKNKNCVRGEIYYVTFEKGVGSEQSGERPCIVIQNDTGNKYGRTTIVALITKVTKSNYLPVHVPLSRSKSKLPHNSVIMTEQLRTIDKERLQRKVSKVDKEVMDQINLALATSIISDSGERTSSIEITPIQRMERAS